MYILGATRHKCGTIENIMYFQILLLISGNKYIACEFLLQYTYLSKHEDDHLLSVNYAKLVIKNEFHIKYESVKWSFHVYHKFVYCNLLINYIRILKHRW